MTEHLLEIISYEQARLMPEGQGCAFCASSHEPHEPHNAVSANYRKWFADRERRLGHWPRQPTWRDAAAHCDQQTRQRWERLLGDCGIDASVSS